MEAGKTLLQSLDLIHWIKATQPPSLLNPSCFLAFVIPVSVDPHALAPRGSPLPFLLPSLPYIMKTNIHSLHKISHCVGISVMCTHTNTGLEISQHRRLPDLPRPSKSRTCDSRIKPTHRLKSSCQQASLHQSPEAARASSSASLAREADNFFTLLCHQLI